MNGLQSSFYYVTIINFPNLISVALEELKESI